MKKILTIFLILLISQFCFAGRLQEMQKAVIAAKNGGSPPAGVSDNFSSDTSANYTLWNGSIAITGGVCYSHTAWNDSLGYHETSLGSADQIVSADVSADYVGPLARIDEVNHTFYIVYSNGSSIRLDSGTGTTLTNLGSYAYTPSYPDKLTVSVDGTTIKAYLDDVEVISVTNSTYSSGNYCGLYINCTFPADVKYIDNLEGDPQ